MHTSTTETKDHEDQNVFLWSTNISNFKPRMNLPSLSDPTILADVNRSSTELEVFFKLFPKSLFEEIANYTNMRLKMLKHETKRFKTLDCTSPEEIMVVLGHWFLTWVLLLPMGRCCLLEGQKYSGGTIGGIVFRRCNDIYLTANLLQ